jgi:nucleoside-diphosphate-sugar epimerase
MKTLVFGGAGFIGRHLVDRFQAQGHSVWAASRRIVPSERHGVFSVPCDLRDAAATESLVASVEPDLVVNAAASPGPRLDEAYGVHLVGALHVLNAVRNLSRPCTIVNFGSAAEYGLVSSDTQPLTECAPCNPVSAYGASKLAATIATEALAHAWRIRALTVRPFNVIGPGCPGSLMLGAIMRRVRSALNEGRPLEISVGRTDTFRDFVSVSNVGSAIAALLATPTAQGTYNISSGKPTRIAELLAMFSRVAGLSINWRTDPAFVRNDDPLISYGSSGKLTRDTGFEINDDLELTIKAMWDELCIEECAIAAAN